MVNFHIYTVKACLHQAKTKKESYPMGSEYYAVDFEKLSRGKEFFAFVCSSFLSVSVKSSRDML